MAGFTADICQPLVRFERSRPKLLTASGDQARSAEGFPHASLSMLGIAGRPDGTVNGLLDSRERTRANEDRRTLRTQRNVFGIPVP